MGAATGKCYSFREGEPVSAHVLVTGVVYRRPEQRTGKNWRPYMTAVLFAEGLESAPYWAIVAFAQEAQAALVRLGIGAAVSIEGALQVEEYEKDGQKRISLGVTAEHAIALQQAKGENRKMDPVAMGGHQQKPAFRPADAIPEFDDDFPR